MPDERTYGFNRDDADALIQSIGVGENWFPEIKPRGSGGTGAQILNFQVISSSPTTRSALVQIEQRTFTGAAYGSTLDDTVVTVYDTDGCYLNEPNVDLTGRRGKAVLMITDDAAAELHFFDDYDPPPKYWCVMSICCPTIVCEE
jgi:hypothetical protein